MASLTLNLLPFDIHGYCCMHVHVYVCVYVYVYVYVCV